MAQADADRPFIVDFYCAEARLIVELDGAQHQDNRAYDLRRTRFLDAQGLRVIRFASEGVWGGDLDRIVRGIRRACETPHLTSPQLSGWGEGY